MGLSVYNSMRFIRDFTFILLCAINICAQVFFHIRILILKEPLFSQCDNVRMYSFGILASTIAMFLTVISSISMYSVRFKSCDPFLGISALFSFGWLGFAGIGSISFFDCKTLDYPLLQTVILLSINSGLALAMLYFGAKHSHRREKSKRPLQPPPIEFSRPFVQLTSNETTTASAATTPTMTRKSTIPKLTKNLSLARSERSIRRSPLSTTHRIMGDTRARPYPQPRPYLQQHWQQTHQPHQPHQPHHHHRYPPHDGDPQNHYAYTPYYAGYPNHLSWPRYENSQ